MFKHFIAVSSVYSEGIRMAWHYTAESYDPNVVQNFFKLLKKKHGEIQLGIHRISTHSLEWDSVVKADSYFKDLIVIEDYNKFIDIIRSEQKLNALDVAQFILSIKPMSHLKLQKLLYLSYERFLKATGEKLFEEPIVAWKYGPVVESVYEAYKGNGSNPIPAEDDDVMLSSHQVAVTPSFMRILSSEHGLTSIDTITAVLKDYIDLSPWELVEVTHEEGKPWHKVYRVNKNKVITDEIILSHS